MDSTDRLQVRDLIEKLSPFDPMARVVGESDETLFEILGVTKGDDCKIYINTDLPVRVSDMEAECNELEDANEVLEKENQELKKKLGRVKDLIASLSL